MTRHEQALSLAGNGVIAVTATPLHALILEDNLNDAELLVAELRHSGFEPTWSRVDDEAGFLVGLAGAPDVVLADYLLPKLTVLDALRLMHDSGYQLPVIVISGVMTEETCVQSLRHGAVDYLLKDRLTRLGPAIRHALAQQELIVQRRLADQRAVDAAVLLQRQADQLTQTNEDLKELDRLKSEFLSTVSHELRTPLTSILGYAEILRDGDVGGELPPAELRIVGIIDQNGRRLLALVENLLDFARMENGVIPLDLSRVDVGELAEAACAAVRPTLFLPAGVVLLTEIQPEPAPVEADRAQLERVVQNLLTNAAKFTRRDGVVAVRVDRDGEQVRISVVDTGIGIPPAEQSRIFERFFRTSLAWKSAIRGSGLGLCISRAIVEAHGGQIDFESALGIGTTFTVRLPGAE